MRLTDLHLPYARHHKSLLIKAALEYKPYIKTEFSLKTSLKTKKWCLKMGQKIYKPRLIMAHVRYSLKLRFVNKIQSNDPMCDTRAHTPPHSSKTCCPECKWSRLWSSWLLQQTRDSQWMLYPNILQMFWLKTVAELKFGGFWDLLAVKQYYQIHCLQMC